MEFELVLLFLILLPLFYSSFLEVLSIVIDITIEGRKWSTGTQ